MKRESFSKIIDLLFIALILTVIVGNISLRLLQHETLRFGSAIEYYDEMKNIQKQFEKQDVKNTESLHALIKDEKIKKNLIVEDERIKYIGDDIKEIKDLRALSIETMYDYHKPYIPEGFYYVDGKWDTGFLISDNKEDEKKGKVQFGNEELIGNQFVWVPVGNANIEYKRVICDNFKGVYTLYSEFANANANIEEVKKIRESVEKYQGFYIARYEASAGIDKVRSISNIEPLNNVIYKEAEKYAADMYKDNTEIISMLPTGEMWDCALENFKIYANINEDSINDDSVKYGNYNNEILKTGENKKYCLNNIFDMAGNVKEWTCESYSQEKGVLRGGSYLENATDAPMSSRDGVESIDSRKEDIGFRVAIYIK